MCNSTSFNVYVNVDNISSVFFFIFLNTKYQMKFSVAKRCWTSINPSWPGIFENNAWRFIQFPKFGILISESFLFSTGRNLSFTRLMCCLCHLEMILGDFFNYFVESKLRIFKDFHQGQTHNFFNHFPQGQIQNF